MTRKVLVIGLGLIGGSIALALQKAPETKIIGYDMDAQTREHAKTLNIVHEIVADPLAVAAEVDVIIFGTPVNATLDWMEQLKSWPLKNKVIVTDTGSTKKLIMQKASELRELGIRLLVDIQWRGLIKVVCWLLRRIFLKTHITCLHHLLGKKLFIWHSLKVC